MTPLHLPTFSTAFGTMCANLWHAAFYIGTLSLLSACATLPPDYTNSDASNSSEIRNQVEQLNNWSLYGKIGFRDGNESYTAAINSWRQIDQNYTIDLSSTFLGLGAIRILGSPEHVTVEESGEEPASSDYPNEILQSILGVPLPVAKLRYWMKGIPAPDTPASSVKDTLGLNTLIEQDGWQIKLSRYQDINALPLPGLIKLEQNDIRISLAIKSWTIY